MLSETKSRKSGKIQYCSENYEATYWLPGNHEYYHDDVGKLLMFKWNNDLCILI